MAEKILFPESPVLLVDDESQFLQSASFSLKSAGISNIMTCNDSREVMKILETTRPELVLLDIMMPFITGKELLPLICGKFPGLHIIIMTAINEVETAVECMKSGACDYLVKPVDKTRLVSSVKKAIDMTELLKENTRLKDSLLSVNLRHPEAFEAVITRNPAMLSIFRYIEAVAKSPMPVLITGETGTGKELLAHAVHAASGRKGEYVALNVAGLDDQLCADTLFGHKKGAFTGAQADRAGLVAKAAGGTLFLDEIGDLSRESQIKLLRLIENKEYFPVGGEDRKSVV
jgi:DNA-binding NtrC family response regulator